jgi:hypothetical protein
MTTLNEHPAQCIQDINKKYKKKVVHGLTVGNYQTNKFWNLLGI